MTGGGDTSEKEKKKSLKKSLKRAERQARDLFSKYDTTE